MRSSYLLVAFGASALAFSTRNQFRWAAVTAAVATLSYLPGGVFALVVVWQAIKRRGTAGAQTTVLWGLGSAIVLLAPVVLLGAGKAFVAQVVVAPLLTSSGGGIIGNFINLWLATGPGILAIPIATAGWVAVGRTNGSWWPAVGGAAFLIKVLVLDMESAPDAMGLMVFVALGIGFTVKHGSNHARKLVAVSIVVLVVSAGIWVGAVRPVSTGGAERSTDDAYAKDSIPQMETIYWEKRTPGCHYRLSQREFQWIERTDAELSNTRCIPWPI